jgi:hypothetical protein
MKKAHLFLFATAIAGAVFFAQQPAAKAQYSDIGTATSTGSAGPPTGGTFTVTIPQASISISILGTGKAPAPTLSSGEATWQTSATYIGPGSSSGGSGSVTFNLVITNNGTKPASPSEYYFISESSTIEGNADASATALALSGTGGNGNSVPTSAGKPTASNTPTLKQLMPGAQYVGVCQATSNAGPGC